MELKVIPNSKCNGCTHYNNNRITCNVGNNPSICGDGSSPAFGYSPMTVSGVDPMLNDKINQTSQVGSPKENPKTEMNVAHFGDAGELLALSERIVADLKKSNVRGCYVHDPRLVGSAFVSGMITSDTAICRCKPITASEVAQLAYKSLPNTVKSKVTVENVKEFIEKSKLV